MKVFDRSARYRLAPVTAVQVGITSALWAVLGAGLIVIGLTGEQIGLVVARILGDGAGRYSSLSPGAGRYSLVLGVVVLGLVVAFLARNSWTRLALPVTGLITFTSVTRAGVMLASIGVALVVLGTVSLMPRSVDDYLRSAKNAAT